MNCQFCGRQLEEGSTHCPYCEIPLQQPVGGDLGKAERSSDTFSVEEWQRRKTEKVREKQALDNEELERRVRRKNVRLKNSKRILGWRIF